MSILSALLDKRIADYQRELLETHYAEVENMYQQMRGWRHDYRNHIQTMKSYASMEDLDSIKRYLDELDTDLSTVDTVIKTGNRMTDAILNSKLTLAEENGLEIKCDAKLPELIPINQVDLCILLGNLIDNAIEACEKIEEKQRKFLRIYLCVMKSQLYISISNATNEVVRKLDKEYITNKRGNHGYGLRRINLIVEKYKGFINRQNEPGVFVTEVMLPFEE